MRTYAMTFITIACILAGAAAAGRSGLPDRDESVSQSESALKKKKHCRGSTFDVNRAGIHESFSTTGCIDESNPFFQDLGTNGRTCETCHFAADGWSINTASIERTFRRTRGHDPLFAHDGQNKPGADLSTLAARRAASSILLERGAFRIDLGPVPVGPAVQFTLESIDDPNEIATPDNIIVYRRPLISANILPGTPIMWDGREPSLETQANTATVAPGHAQGNVSLTTQQRADMAAFQLNLFVAQVIDWGTGDLRRAGGGPEALAATPFVLNQNANKLPMPPRLTQDVFTLYGDWADSGSTKRQRVFRGREIFNKRPIGPVPLQATGFTTCSSCHSALDNSGGNDLAATPAPPNLGGNFTNTNVSGGGVAGVLVAPSDIAPFLHQDLPKYTFRHKPTGRLVTVTDPGRGLISGIWADIGRFKIPTLRGLAARAPYFHNGSAATLRDVLEHYNTAFMSPGSCFPVAPPPAPPACQGWLAPPLFEDEMDDLVAFLETL